MLLEITGDIVKNRILKPSYREIHLLAKKQRSRYEPYAYRNLVIHRNVWLSPANEATLSRNVDQNLVARVYRGSVRYIEGECEISGRMRGKLDVIFCPSSNVRIVDGIKSLDNLN